MEQVFGKFNYYDLFGHLLPGVIIGLLLNFLITSTNLDINLTFITDSVILNLFIFYFFGLVLNRVSASIIEPLLIKLKKINKEPYKNIVKAEKEDYKLVQLQAVIISYRTFVAGFSFVLLLLLVCYSLNILNISSGDFFILFFTILFLTVIFLISFIKQYNKYSERVQYYN